MESENIYLWFIDEQVEEEDTFSTLVSKLDRIKDNEIAIYIR